MVVVSLGVTWSCPARARRAALSASSGSDLPRSRRDLPVGPVDLDHDARRGGVGTWSGRRRSSRSLDADLRASGPERLAARPAAVRARRRRRGTPGCPAVDRPLESGRMVGVAVGVDAAGDIDRCCGHAGRSVLSCPRRDGHRAGSGGQDGNGLRQGPMRSRPPGSVPRGRPAVASSTDHRKGIRWKPGQEEGQTRAAGRAPSLPSRRCWEWGSRLGVGGSGKWLVRRAGVGL